MQRSRTASKQVGAKFHTRAEGRKKGREELIQVTVIPRDDALIGNYAETIPSFMDPGIEIDFDFN